MQTKPRLSRLGEGVENRKFPKVVTRGCKRCFGPREQRSPKGLLHLPKPVLHRATLFCTSARGFFCSLGPKDLLHPLVSTFGNFLFSTPSPRRLDSLPQTLTIAKREVVFGVLLESLSLDTEKSFLSHRKSGSCFDPRPQCLMSFHLILVGRTESLLRKPRFP